MLFWKENFSIGMEIIDAQHKHLFDIGNQAYLLLENGLKVDKYDDITLIIEDLERYTIYHFKCEEEYMLKINYSGYENQKREHTEFINKIHKMRLVDIDKGQQEAIEDLLAVIFNWLIDHILGEDRLIMGI
ncbi:hemerythrin family protein [Clostridium estertheticum]|uniref:bacteriohemerythrin n=1 Tax=Clostridium estertheticum TaxID=238834 RepID=UPI001C0E8657|nr:hemerythrin family protein [Clostridium estertheticum]MBU3179004.1 hemerythrin family protein [Clostridium estertheticum]